MAKQRRTEDDFKRDMEARRRNPDLDPTRAETADRETYIKRGQDAWKRHKDDATWTDWLAIGEALEIGRSDAMAAAHTNQPIGSRYNAAFGKWLARHGFDDIDQGDRKRLFDVMEHRSEIEEWRKTTLTQTERLRANHPSTVWRKFNARNKPKRDGAGGKLGELTRENKALKDHVAELEAARETAPTGKAKPLTVKQHFAALVTLLQDLPLEEAQAQLTAFGKTLSKASAERRFERGKAAKGSVKKPGARAKPRVPTDTATEIVDELSDEITAIGALVWTNGDSGKWRAAAGADEYLINEAYLIGRGGTGTTAYTVYFGPPGSQLSTRRVIGDHAKTVDAAKAIAQADHDKEDVS